MAMLQTVLLATALSADAFIVAASVAILDSFSLKKTLILSTSFALVQSFLFALGFFIGDFGAHFALDFFHWLGFILLSILGLRAIKEGFSCPKERETLHLNSLFALLLLSISVSIDALVAGIPYPIISSEGLKSFIIVALVTFLLSFLGASLSIKLGNKRCLSIFAGLVLIAIGLSFVL